MKSLDPGRSIHPIAHFEPRMLPSAILQRTHLVASPNSALTLGLATSNLKHLGALVDPIQLVRKEHIL